MRIAIVTAFPRDVNSPHGGVESVSVNLVKALARLAEAEVHVVTDDGGITSSESYSWEGAVIHRVPRSPGKMLSNAITSGRKTISSFLNDVAPDIVHSHDVYGLMVKGLNVPRVFTVHGFIYADTLVAGEAFARLRSWVWRRVEVGGWKDQRNIISISPYVRERILRLTNVRIFDINNPVSEEFFDIERDPGKNIIFSSSAIYPRKNIKGLIKAFSDLVGEGVDAELRIAGREVDKTYAFEVRALIDKLKIKDKVKLLGEISSEAVKAELSRASIYALVSLEENSPMGIEEAMASGVPVVASNRCGMPYMVADEVTGRLVDAKSPMEIARAFKEILFDGEMREKMSEASRKKALKEYHPDRIAEETFNVYKEIVYG